MGVLTHAPNQETLALDPLAALEQALGYQFHARALLVQALTHRSFTRDEPTQPHNERLEFLGDAVLQLTVTLRLLDLFPAAGEGELSRSTIWWPIRSCSAWCAATARPGSS